MGDLNYCPFCGYVDVEMFELPNGYSVVHCDGCGAEVSFYKYAKGTAIAYNRRVENDRRATATNITGII